MAPIRQTNAKRDSQFSLKALLAGMTAACVVAALPGGVVLLGILAAWIALTAAVFAILLAFRARIYRLLAGPSDRDDRR